MSLPLQTRRIRTASVAPAFTRAPCGLLQRKCACGGTPGLDGECAECRKKRQGTLQRRGSGPEPDEVPSIVHEVLQSASHPLDEATRAYLEPRFGHDFSQVRVHSDVRAAASALAVNALAYTVGRNIVFGAGQYEPHAPQGFPLLSHELTHVIQQDHARTPPASGLAVALSDDRAEAEAKAVERSVTHQLVPAAGQLPRVSRTPPCLRRLGVFESIGVFFGLVEGDFSWEELQAYTAKLLRERRIEGSFDSDNKARAIVRRWKQGGYAFDLVPELRKLLILEMLDGYVSEGDEMAILDILDASNRNDLQTIFSAGGVQASELQRRITGEQSAQRLQNFFATRFAGGVEAAVRGEIRPVVGIRLGDMDAAQRRSFIQGNFPPSERRLATQVLNDLAESEAELDFSNEEELRTEISKRVRTSLLIQESQRLYGVAFEYPNHPAAKRCLSGSGAGTRNNPRVNRAAEPYWGPVQGDPNSLYYFDLSPEGRRDPYQALVALFTPQRSICDMTLIHCDYLASVVHFRTFAETIGRDEFNRRVQSGVIQMRLAFNGFQGLIDTGVLHAREAVSLQWARPTSERDLVIGDHVIFFNHRAYDLINCRIRNAWRLENAILIEKNPSGEDVFLGHGSGRKTHRQMRQKLMTEYNEVVIQAERLIARTRSSDAGVQSEAQRRLAEDFPNIEHAAGSWQIRYRGACFAPSFGAALTWPVQRVTDPFHPDILGLHDPDSPSQLYPVRRPIESR